MQTFDSKTSYRHITAALALIAAAVFLSLFFPWEMGGESWGYWFFAKLSAAGKGFVTSDRAPFYTVYLLPFRLLPYPLSTAAESFVTDFLCALGVFWFLTRRLDVWQAALFAILWIPFFEEMPPPTQALALACVCAAFALRSAPAAGRLLSVSYALLLMAMLLRPNFGVFLVLVLAYDFWQYYRERNGAGRALLRTATPLVRTPCLLVIGFAVALSFAPSPHRWNNAWLATTDWFPGSKQSLGSASIIGHFNWRYIEKQYGTYEGKDIYFTHREAFANAPTVEGMIRANPRLFAEIEAENAVEFFSIADVNWSFFTETTSRVRRALAFLVFLGIVFGAWRACADWQLGRVFVAASVLSAVAAAVSYPKVRYMFPLIPSFGLCAWWYAKKVEELVRRAYNGRFATPIAKSAVLASMLLFSWLPLHTWIMPLRTWIRFAVVSHPWIRRAVTSIRPLHKAPPGVSIVSMKAAFKELSNEAAGCRGIMTLEHNYFAAFVVDDSRTAVYDVFEIPPFGDFGASPYKGLNPQRVDCLFISSDLEQTIGYGTNIRLRFDHYVRPYEKFLLAHGGASFPISHYGRVVKRGGSLSAK